MTDYKTFSAAVQRIGCESHAAELHGQLAGLLCARQELTTQQWLDESVPELASAQRAGDALAGESYNLLQAVFQQTRTSLQERQLKFQLLLSDDDTPLPHRISELGEWCQGFLLGLAMGGIKDFRHLPGELPDLLDDLVEISQAGNYELQDESEDEAAFIELNEYVRLGVIMVWEEIHQIHSGQPEQPSIH